MQRILLTILLIGALGISPAPAQAKKLYTWSDADGVTHITETPPPSGAKLIDVIHYQPRTPEQLRKIEARQRQMRQEAQNDALQNRIERAERQLRAARETAEAARARVREAEADLEQFIENVGQNRSRQRRFSYDIRSRENTVLEARQAALQAEEAVREAEAQLTELQRQTEEGDNGPPSPPSTPSE